MKTILISFSPEETKKIGKKLAKKLIKRQKKAQVLSLEGELGGGKTTFLKGLAKGVGIEVLIRSPSFVIMKKYKLEGRKRKVESGKRELKVKSGKKFKKSTSHFPLPTFYHFDCYRVQKSREIISLGWKEITSNPKNIVAVEWGNRIKNILPQDHIQIRFEFLDEYKRRITIANLY